MTNPRFTRPAAIVGLGLSALILAGCSAKQVDPASYGISGKIVEKDHDREPCKGLHAAGDQVAIELAASGGGSVILAAPTSTKPKPSAPKTTAPKTTAPKTTAPKTPAPKVVIPAAPTTKSSTTKAKPRMCDDYELGIYQANGQYEEIEVPKYLFDRYQEGQQFP